MARKLILLEPSKVGNQHITLIVPYLEALVAAAEALRKADGKDIRVEAWLSKATLAYIPARLKAAITCHAIPVIDPNARHFVRKVLLEWFVTLRVGLTKRPGDLLLVTCMMSPALYLLEKIGRILPIRGVHVVLHSELEALLDPTLRTGMRTYGFWCRKWWKARKTDSKIGLVVIDYFIREKLLALMGGTATPQKISVLCLPIQADTSSCQPRMQPRPRVCFIGYRSEFKGYKQFLALAGSREDFEWVAIGGGVLENIDTGERRKLETGKDYHDALASCDIALFPYLQAYDISLSAAAIDAISAGLYCIASSRGCFTALCKTFGRHVVNCYDDPAEINAMLDEYLEAPGLRADDRTSLIEQTHYSKSAVSKQMLSFVAAGLPVTARGSR